MTDYLQRQAGLDTRQDAFYSGYITAVKDLLNVTLDVVKES